MICYTCAERTETKKKIPDKQKKEREMDVFDMSVEIGSAYHRFIQR